VASKTTEVDRPADADGQVVSESVELVPLHAVREALISGQIPEMVDPDAVAREIAMMLLEAKTPEALFAAPGTTKPVEILDQPFVLERVRFMPSTIEDAKSPIYALMDLLDHHGEVRVVPCGGQAVVVQCLRAVEEGWLPVSIRLVEAGRQREGRNRPLYLVMDQS
jgi:hypothetical protein